MEAIHLLSGGQMNLTPRTPLPLLLLQSRAPRKLWPLEELGGWAGAGAGAWAGAGAGAACRL